MFPPQQIHCPQCFHVMSLTSSAPDAFPNPFCTADAPNLVEAMPPGMETGSDIAFGYPILPLLSFSEQPQLDSCPSNPLPPLDPGVLSPCESPDHVHGIDISILPLEARYILYLRFGRQLSWYRVASEYGKVGNCLSPSPSAIQMRLRRLRLKCPAMGELYRKHKPAKAAPERPPRRLVWASRPALPSNP